MVFDDGLGDMDDDALRESFDDAADALAGRLIRLARTAVRDGSEPEARRMAEYARLRRDRASTRTDDRERMIALIRAWRARRDALEGLR